MEKLRLVCFLLLTKTRHPQLHKAVPLSWSVSSTLQFVQWYRSDKSDGAAVGAAKPLLEGRAGGAPGVLAASLRPGRAPEEVAVKPEAEALEAAGMPI